MEGIRIRILIVDDDNICLKIISEFLQRMNHHVVTMKNPIDALFSLQSNYDSFDLILTDVHMPQMNGLDLLRHVKQKSELPVVLMSADCNKDIMRRGLEDGASFYMVKPITKESLTKLWQFAIKATNSSRRKKSKGVEGVIERGNIDNHNNNLESLFLTSVHGRYQGDTIVPNKMILKRTSPVFDEEKGINKKPKLIWTTSLHNIFLEAVHKIGLEKAVPKKIMELMNVPGLRRENVASHLQKYRIFLKRISESSNFSEDGIPINSNDRPLRSSFILNEITYLTNNFQQQYQELLTNGRKEKRGDAGIKTLNQIPPKVNRIEGSSGDRVIGNDNYTIGKIQSTPNNYVGLRISTNGELIGTLKDMSNGYNNGNNNNGNNNYSASNNFSQNEQIPSFGIDDFNLKEPNDEGLRGVNNVNICISDFGQESLLLDAPQGVISNNHEDIFGTGFEFGSFDVHENNFESFDRFDQGLFLNDDDTFLFENYYEQAFGQTCSGDYTQDGNFTKQN